MAFEEISIFNNGGHLGYRTALTDTILKGDHLRIISAKFGWNWLSSFRGEDSFKISSPLFSILSLVAILVGSRDQRTPFWKGAIQESFQQNLVDIGSVVSEKIFLKFHPPFFLICIIGQNRQKFKVHKKSCNIC